MPFWKRRPQDPIETLLSEHRPEPREAFLRSLLEQVGQAPRARTAGIRPRPAAVRLLAAAALTVLALVAATAAAGGVGAASHGIASVATGHAFGLDSNKNTSPAQSTNTLQANDNAKKDPGQNQYSVTICHATGSKTNPYVQLTLSPQGAANHLAHHPGDFLAPPEGCPGKHKK
jgi:hypothetical protein